MTTFGPHTGTCKACGLRVAIVNYGRASWGEKGYLSRHTRPGTRAGSKCRGSFGTWVERRATIAPRVIP